MFENLEKLGHTVFQRFHLSALRENAMSDDFKPAPGHDLGRVLAVLRASRGLSKTDLANASGVPSSNISQYELGNQIPELKTLRRLLAAMGYTLAAIEPTERYLAQLDGLDHALVVGPRSSPSERIDAVAAEAAKTVFQWTRSCLAFLSENWVGTSPAAEPAPTEETEEPIAPLDLGAGESPPPGEPPTEAWTRLARKPLPVFRTALKGDPSGADHRFVEWLGARSEARAAASPDKALEDAERAVAAAEQLAPSGQHPIVGLAQAFLGNAFRVANDSDAAEQAFALSEKLVARCPLPTRLEVCRLDLFASFPPIAAALRRGS